MANQELTMVDVLKETDKVTVAQNKWIERPESLLFLEN